MYERYDPLTTNRILCKQAPDLTTEKCSALQTIASIQLICILPLHPGLQAENSQSSSVRLPPKPLPVLLKERAERRGGGENPERSLPFAAHCSPLSRRNFDLPSLLSHDVPSSFSLFLPLLLLFLLPLLLHLPLLSNLCLKLLQRQVCLQLVGGALARSLPEAPRGRSERLAGEVSEERRKHEKRFARMRASRESRGRAGARGSEESKTDEG
eukprot:747360-Hanusia_phi.AAC.2